MPLPRYDPSAVDIKTIIARFGILVPPTILLLGAIIVSVHGKQDDAMGAMIADEERQRCRVGQATISHTLDAIAASMRAAKTRIERAEFDADAPDLESVLTLTVPQSAAWPQSWRASLRDATGTEVASLDTDLRPRETAGNDPSATPEAPIFVNSAHDSTEPTSTPVADAAPKRWITLSTPIQAHGSTGATASDSLLEVSLDAGSMLQSVHRGMGFAGPLCLLDHHGVTVACYAESTPPPGLPEEQRRIDAGQEPLLEKGEHGWMTFASIDLPDHVFTGPSHSDGEPPTAPPYWLWSYLPKEVIKARCRAVHGGLRSLFTVLSGGILIAGWILARYAAQRDASSQRAFQAERLAAIGEAMTALAHESRNAIQRGQASIEMLAKRVKEVPDAAKLLGRLQCAQEDLHELYERVRSYASPMPLNRRRVDLREIVEQAWEELADHTDGRDVRFSLQVRSTDSVAEVDPFAMRRAVQNVLENALSPENDEGIQRDAVRVDVAIGGRRFAGRSALYIAIRDNGPGIDPAVAPRIFEPFFTTRSRGTGLGMAIVRRIVELHGGRVEIAGTRERGTMVVITIPAATRGGI